MGKALYRKYRPKKLEDVVGQEHITTTLANSLKSDNVNHAYLFTGPRGVGKTSIARILAHDVNGLDYDEDTSHLDIIEIDAASNRRIDEVRALREKVHNAPTSVKYKVYIIDEVHMLTKEAFNALLKTLEEPPEHAIFILATTEAHKLPDTIISRCIRFTFRPVGTEQTVEHLKGLAREEKIEIDDEALELIAHHGSGSFRDSISLLDQLGSQGSKVDIEKARRALGLAPDAAVDELLNIISDRDVPGVVNTLQELYRQGYSAPQLAGQLSQKLREGLISQKSQVNKDLASTLLKDLLNVPASHDPAVLLEITLIESAFDESPASQNTSPQPSKKTEKTFKPKVESNPEKNQDEKPPKKDIEEERKEDSKKPAVPQAEGIFDEEKWTEVLNELKKERNTLYGIARMAVPNFEGNEITLAFKFPFHKRRFDDSKNKQFVSDIIKRTTGHDIIISCVVEQQQEAPAETAPEELTEHIPDNEDLKAISDIFGDAEVLE